MYCVLGDLGCERRTRDQHLLIEVSTLVISTLITLLHNVKAKQLKVNTQFAFFQIFWKVPRCTRVWTGHWKVHYLGKKKRHAPVVWNFVECVYNTYRSPISCTQYPQYSHFCSQSRFLWLSMPTKETGEWLPRQHKSTESQRMCGWTLADESRLSFYHNLFVLPVVWGIIVYISS